jgi:hypothetical protein
MAKKGCAFVIVGRSEPLFEANLGEQSDDSAHLNQLILHSALDMVDRVVESTPSLYLRVVDRFNDQNVFAFVTAGSVRFLLLHEGRNEDAVKAFFAEVHELYTKQQLNPFYTYDTPIVSPVFNARVRSLARRYIL